MKLTDAFPQEPHAKVFWGQSAEDAVLVRFMASKRNGFYVDVGAHHPRRYSNTYLFYNYFGWRGLNIDASSQAISRFNKERPRDINVHALVGEAGSPLTFTAFAGKARSTADAERTKRLEAKGVEVISKTIMHPRPLRDILAEHLDEEQKIDFMDVDIEGLDLQALRTNDWSRFGPEFVCVEDFAFKNGKDSEIRKYMTEIGYLCVSHCFDTSIYRRA